MNMFHTNEYKDDLKQLKVFKTKTKTGSVDRVVNEYELIVKSMFKKEFDIKRVEGMKVNLVSGEQGVITGSFGQSGKIKVTVQAGIKDVNLITKGSAVSLTFNKFVYQKSIKQ